MTKNGKHKKASPTPGLIPKTIRFHGAAWERVRVQAGHINPSEWLRSEIYEKILGITAPRR